MYQVDFFEWAYESYLDLGWENICKYMLKLPRLHILEIAGRCAMGHLLSHLPFKNNTMLYISILINKKIHVIQIIHTEDCRELVKKKSFTLTYILLYLKQNAFKKPEEKRRKVNS